MSEHYTDGRRWSRISQGWILEENWNDKEELACMTEAAESIRKENELLKAALAQKDAEIAKLKHELKQDEYKFIRNHNDYYKELCGMREQIDQLRTELDRVLGEAVGFAGIIKSTRVWAADVEQAIQFLTNPLVQSWRARQGKEAG